MNRAAHMLAVFLVGVAVALGVAGLPRTAVIVLAADILLLVRSLERLRTARPRPENRS